MTGLSLHNDLLNVSLHNIQMPTHRIYIENGLLYNRKKRKEIDNNTTVQINKLNVSWRNI